MFSDSVDQPSILKSKNRQLEIIAFPVGIAIGSVGALLWPTLFPATTTTTTTVAPIVSLAETGTSGTSGTSGSLGTSGTSGSSGSSGSSGTITDTDGAIVITGDTTTEAAKPTPAPQRDFLEDFPDCGEKGSASRVVGGTEITENEYPWLCSLKYKGYHICGITLLSGPPHDTILVGAAHCFSVGDTFSNYKVKISFINDYLQLLFLIKCL